MDSLNRKYIDFERSRSERSHPSPARSSKFYDKNQKIVNASTQNIKYPKFKPDL